MIVWFLLQLSQGVFYFAASMLDESYALTVMAVAGVFTAWRMASIAHPFAVARPRRIGARAGVVLAAPVAGRGWQHGYELEKGRGSARARRCWVRATTSGPDSLTTVQSQPCSGRYRVKLSTRCTPPPASGG